MSPSTAPIEIESRSSQPRRDRPTTCVMRTFCACNVLVVAVTGAALCAGRLARPGTTLFLAPPLRPAPRQAVDEATAGARHAHGGAGRGPASEARPGGGGARFAVVLPGGSGPLAWVYRILEDTIPGTEHLEVLDVSDGHTASGFVDGSNRSQNPGGLELRITIVSGDFEGKRLLQRQRSSPPAPSTRSPTCELSRRDSGKRTRLRLSI